MKLWVIIASNGILGHTGCAGVFDSKEKAEEAVEKYKYAFDDHLISECELNIGKGF